MPLWNRTGNNQDFKLRRKLFDFFLPVVYKRSGCDNERRSSALFFSDSMNAITWRVYPSPCHRPESRTNRNTQGFLTICSRPSDTPSKCFLIFRGFQNPCPRFLYVLNHVFEVQASFNSVILASRSKLSIYMALYLGSSIPFWKDPLL